MKKYLFYFIYLIFLLPAVIFAYRKPDYNWDMLGYIGTIVALQNKNVDSIHAITYQTVKNDIPKERYDQLIDSSHPYRKKMAASPEAFYSELPIYFSKPLYIASVWLFYKLGFSPGLSTVLPSIFSYLIIGFILFYWVKKYLNGVFSFTISLLIMYFAFMIQLARGSSPDLFSALALFMAMFFIFERPSVFGLTVFLVLSVFIRLDNIITSVFIFSLLAFTHKGQIKISIRQYLLLLSSLAVFYFMITGFVSRYGWNSFYFSHFFKTNLLQHPEYSISVKGYLRYMYSAIIAGVLYSHVTIFLFLMGLIIYKQRVFKIRAISFDDEFCFMILFIMITRFLLFPQISDRFYVVFYLIIIILFIRNFMPLKKLTAK